MTKECKLQEKLKEVRDTLKDRGCRINCFRTFFVILIVITGLEIIRRGKDIVQPSIIVGLLDLILTTLIITSILTFGRFLLFVNRRKIGVKRRAEIAESYIFDLGDCIFAILNHTFIPTYFKKERRQPFIFNIPPGTAKIIVRKLDSIQKHPIPIPEELKKEFLTKKLQLPEKAKVWSFGDDEWRIHPAEKSHYIIKKKSRELRIYRSNYSLVDSWVLGNLLLTIPIFWFWSSIPSQFPYQFLKWGAAIWGGYRVYEALTYQIKVVLFDPERARMKKRPARLNPYRSLILTLVGYVNIIIWFAIFYREYCGLNSRFDSLNFSFYTMTTFGHPSISPASNLGASLVFLQSVIGLFMVLVIIAAFLSSLPRPKYWEEFES